MEKCTAGGRRWSSSACTHWLGQCSPLAGQGIDRPPDPIHTPPPARTAPPSLPSPTSASHPISPQFLCCVVSSDANVTRESGINLIIIGVVVVVLTRGASLTLASSADKEIGVRDTEGGREGGREAMELIAVWQQRRRGVNSFGLCFLLLPPPSLISSSPPSPSRGQKAASESKSSTWPPPPPARANMSAKSACSWLVGCGERAFGRRAGGRGRTEINVALPTRNATKRTDGRSRVGRQALEGRTDGRGKLFVRGGGGRAGAAKSINL